MKKRELVMTDITAMYEIHAQAAVKFINNNETKELAPQLIAMWVGDEPGSVRYGAVIDPEIVGMLHRDSRGKDHLMALTRLLLDQGSEMIQPPDETMGLTPDMVVHVSEGWVLRKSLTEAELDHPRGHLDGYRSVSEHPDRGEVVLVTVHTPHQSHIGQCPIKTEGGKRTAIFNPLEPAAQVTGRMTLNPEGPHAQH